MINSATYVQDIVDDSDPWGSAEIDDLADEYHESNDHSQNEEADIVIPLMNGVRDPSLKSMMKTMAKDGYRTGKAQGELQCMQHGFDFGFAHGMIVGRSCGRALGHLRRIFAHFGISPILNISNYGTEATPEVSVQERNVLAAALLQAESYLMYTLPQRAISALASSKLEQRYDAMAENNWNIAVASLIDELSHLLGTTGTTKPATLPTTSITTSAPVTEVSISLSTSVMHVLATLEQELLATPNVLQADLVAGLTPPGSFPVSVQPSNQS